MAHLYHDREPPPDHSLLEPPRYSAPTLRSGGRRISCNSSRGTPAPQEGRTRKRVDPRTLASHLDGPWRVVCVQEGAGFVTDRSLAENFYCAVLLNKDTFERGHTCAPIQVPCSLRYSSWAVEGMVVTGKFRRAPSCLLLHGCEHPCRQRMRKKKAIRVHCVISPRPICASSSLWFFYGDFNKGAEREALSGGSDDHRRISPLEAAFSFASVPTPTFGVTPCASALGARPMATKWPESCGLPLRAGIPQSMSHQAARLVQRHPCSYRPK